MSFLSKRKKQLGDVLICVLLLVIFSAGALSYVEHRLQDLVYQKVASIDPNIVIIGIDEETLAAFGTPDQWSRQLMADAINILNSSEEYKPAVIAVDILYVGERADQEADANFAKAAKDGGNVVVAARYVIGYIQDPANPSRVYKTIVDFERPYPALAEYAAYGVVNAPFDEGDSAIRGTYVKYMSEGKNAGEVLYSFPYEIARAYLGGELPGPPPDFRERYITYYDLPGAYKQLSLAEVFDEDFDPGWWADCIVMIGPYAAGLMDAYYVPISHELMNGVEIHANVVQMLLEGQFKEYAPLGVNLAILLAAIAIAIALAYFLGIRALLCAYAAISVAYYFLALYLFDQGHIVSLAYPASALILIYLYQLVYGYVLETLEKQKVKSAFKKYVDPKLVDKLIDSGEANSDEVGVKKDIAVLFVDVRGFTPMTEALSGEPETVVKILNDYLELTASAVFNNGGSVDKFIGDATMALFNGFVPLDDYVYKSVKAAWDIVQGAAEINAALKEKYNVDVGFGVGIHCGSAIVGNLGPSFRKDYTAIGDTVNTAARLESNAKASEVLISDKVYNIVKDRIEAVSIGEIPLKGKSVKMEIYSVKSVIIL